MDAEAVPTKGNLMLAKNTLNFSHQGYTLLDQKRNVLIREMVALAEQSTELRIALNEALAKAYTALQVANMEMGAYAVEKAGHKIPTDDTIHISTKHLMGVELPQASYNAAYRHMPELDQTTASLDNACVCFNEVKDILITLAGVENAARRLSEHIIKTNKRANALKNITIPKLESRVQHIQDSLEERERDNFTRLKVIKSRRPPIN